MSGGSLKAVVIPAAGSGRRIGAGVNKLLLPLAGEPLLAHTLRAVAAAEPDRIVLVTRPDEREAMAAVAAAAGCPVSVADGGPTRQASVARGVQALPDQIELIAVHDGARPLLTADLLNASFAAAAEHGAAVVAVPVADTLKVVDDDLVTGSVDRARMWAMQTPQTFRAEWLREAIRYAAVTGFEGTDEVSLIEHLGRPVRVVPGSPRNLKVTRPDDYALAEGWLRSGKETMVPPRVGYGYDVHQLVEGRELWLGGVKIDSPVGLLGHSDADVLLHAVCDALLGAAGLGDIGRHFPDTDERYRGIASLRLLEATRALLAEAGYQVLNVDVTVVAERPKLAPHVPEMVARIGAVLTIEKDCVNIKATTHEQLGALGAGLGMAAHAVATIVKA